jgi:hypothetical protein
MEQQMQQSDHDLLVTLVAKVDAFISGQNATQSDHESRIRVLEQANTVQQGSSQARKDVSNTTKWVIGTLIGLLGLAVAGIGILLGTK